MCPCMLQLGPNLLCLLELVKRTRQERVSCSPFPKRQNANQLYNQSELLESSASYAGCVMFLCLPILVQDGKAGKLGRGIRSEAPETQHNASLVPPCATWWESEEQALLPSLPLHGSGGGRVRGKPCTMAAFHLSFREVAEVRRVKNESAKPPNSKDWRTQ